MGQFSCSVDDGTLTRSQTRNQFDWSSYNCKLIRLIARSKLRYKTCWGTCKFTCLYRGCDHVIALDGGCEHVIALHRGCDHASALLRRGCGCESVLECLHGDYDRASERLCVHLMHANEHDHVQSEEKAQVKVYHLDWTCSKGSVLGAA